METGHRSILVMDDAGQVKGILTINDLLMELVSSLKSAETADHSERECKGKFITNVKRLCRTKVGKVMTPAPRTIDGRASLMEAVCAMVNNNLRRLVVMLEDRAVGVLREQDLFFEMERALREKF